MPGRYIDGQASAGSIFCSRLIQHLLIFYGNNLPFIITRPLDDPVLEDCLQHSRYHLQMRPCLLKEFRVDQLVIVPKILLRLCIHRRPSCPIHFCFVFRSKASHLINPL